MKSEQKNNDQPKNQKKVESLIRKINDSPDKLHSDYTPAVHELINYELLAVKTVLPLLNSDDTMERYRAQRVVEGVIQRRFGWKAGQGYPLNSDGEQQFLVLWKVNGNYNADDPEEIRLKAIKLWENWLKENYTNENE